MTTTPSASNSWIDDDPLSPGHGRLPAYDQFDELANGQTVHRANRVPRVAPPRPSLLKRAWRALRALYLQWLLYDLGEQLDTNEATQARLADEAHQASQRFRYSPLLNSRRRDLRRQHAEIARRMLGVRRELDNLAGQ